MEHSLRILLIDEDPTVGALVQQGLQREFEKVEVEQAKTAAEFEAALHSHFDFAITCLRLSWTDGPKVSARLKSRDSDMQVILLLTAGDEDMVVEAVKAGLDGYVFKTGNYLERLLAAIGLAFERRVQRRAAREAEAQLHILFDRVPIGLYRITPAGQILEANPALAQLIGYSDRDKLMAHNVVEFFVSTENFSKWREQVGARGVVHDFEGPARRLDGRLIWVRNSARAVRDADGEVIYYEGAIEDISERRRVEEDNLRERMLTDKTLDSMPGVFYLFDENGRYLRWNHNLERVSGYSGAEISQMHPLDMVEPEDRDNVAQKISDAFRTGAASVETHLRAKDGTCTLYHFTGQRIELDGQPCLIGTGMDISARKRAEDEIRLLQTIALTISEETSDLNSALEVVLRKVCETTGWLVGEAWLPNADNTYLEFSGASYTATPELEDFVSHSRDFRFARGQPVLGRVWESKQAMWVADLGREASDVQRAPVAMAAGLKAAMGIPVLAGQAIVAVLGFLTGEARPRDQHLMDIVSGVAAQLGLAIQRKHADARVHYLVHFDRLTGLPNRTLFADRLQQAVIEAARHQRLVGVVFVDLDRFKNINDSLGHAVGDQLVKDVAVRLSAAVREGDTVARLSGDEFALVLADMAQADDAARLARKILNVFVQPFHSGGHEIFITASLGITLYPIDDKEVTGLLRNADVAMYRAKESGRNTYQFYSADMTSRAAENLTLENDLRHAIERDELILHYQPLVESQTGRMLGVEALVRWAHGKRGLISPMQFIPLAEESGLIVPVGEWVLRKACAQCQAWRRNGYPDMRIAVNLSARQFREGLDITVIGILQEVGLDPSALELELTEGVIMQSSHETLTVMQRLADRGVTFSIDDFGTGYSNLSYLKRFPVDILKVDRSFVKDIPGDLDDSAIADAIITMAHSLGMKVIAEGVETEQQSAFMRSHGCDAMQGYYFSKPVSAEDISVLLQREHSKKKTA